MSVYTTEIASESISSDNPIHQRLLKAYFVAKPYIHGSLLEVGCGEGRGVELLAPIADSYYALDKIQSVIEELSKQYPQSIFRKANVPPFKDIEDNSFDVIVSFQVIEHIQDDRLFLEEIFRVLKPGGTALITTPNIKKSLSRNPWHIREYTGEQLKSLAAEIFDKVEMRGITGNDKIWEYYQRNKRSVEKIMRWDILNLQYKLPASLLRIPYELLNRMNRNKLESTDDNLVNSITHEDYLLSEEADASLDLFGILKKLE
jgi:2-polyprenyl-3-methyl-5-hydroxy-6-metoxy-1,4-benzoquinol methylase